MKRKPVVNLMRLLSEPPHGLTRWRFSEDLTIEHVSTGYCVDLGRPRCMDEYIELLCATTGHPWIDYLALSELSRAINAVEDFLDQMDEQRELDEAHRDDEDYWRDE